MDTVGAEHLLALASCANCGREVLTGVEYDDAGNERRVCVHCDVVLETELRLVDESELAELDYAFVEDEGCGRPDCGRGRCGR